VGSRHSLRISARGPPMRPIWIPSFMSLPRSRCRLASVSPGRAMVDDTAPGASIPVLVLYFVFQQQFIEGLTAGALKH
jgi:hypothetical protein